MTAYYNEHDKYAAAWLRNLIAEGLISPGDVDERSIEDVEPSELLGYTQCHFFAGIGVWSYALRRAGWQDDRPVWTGSCPCQPFSAAGKGGGEADERHLWPAFFHLIQHAKPRDVAVFGEQVASKPGLAWLDLVHADLEGQGYAVGAVDLCAAGVGAPHIRQRSFFVGHPVRATRERNAGEISATQARLDGAQGSERPVGGDTHDAGSQGRRVSGADSERLGGSEQPVGAAGTVDHGGAVVNPESEQVGISRRTRKPRSATTGVALGDADRAGLQGRTTTDVPGAGGGHEGRTAGCAGSAPGPTNGRWANAEWLPCIDGKARPVEPGAFPLAHGAPARVGRLRAYGNAIVAPAAEAFIRAYLG